MSPSEVTLNPKNIQNEDRKLLEATTHRFSQAFLPHLAALRPAHIQNMYQSSFSRFYSSGHRLYNSTFFLRASIRLLEPLSLNSAFNCETIYSPSYKTFPHTKIARDPEEDTIYHNTLNWAIIYHERRGLSPLKGFWLPSLKQKDQWLLPTLANLVKQVRLPYPNKVGILKNHISFAWKQYTWQFYFTEFHKLNVNYSNEKRMHSDGRNNKRSLTLMFYDIRWMAYNVKWVLNYKCTLSYKQNKRGLTWMQITFEGKKGKDAGSKKKTKKKPRDREDSAN